MNLSVLHLSLNGPATPLPWHYNFNSRGLVVLSVGSVREASSYFRAYPVLLALIELGNPIDEAQLEALRTLAAARSEESPPPLLGIYRGELSAEARAQLSAAGLDMLMAHQDPDHFLAWHVELLLSLNELRHYEQTRMDVGGLARKTREQLHDLSQPLSAVQGRLQLLAAKCPADDPNAKIYQDLVTQTLAITRHVMDLQQLHRKFSQ